MPDGPAVTMLRCSVINHLYGQTPARPVSRSGRPPGRQGVKPQAEADAVELAEAEADPDEQADYQQLLGSYHCIGLRSGGENCPRWGLHHQHWASRITNDFLGLAPPEKAA